MRVGLHALGIGPGANPAVAAAVATSAEAAGFATLWAGEHVVMVDRPDTPYPYAADGRIAVDSAADWLDPLVLLGFLAAHTTRIRLATGILLLPEHQPLLAAKQAATVDVLSGGRLTLGIGIGWSREEFAALGVPFAGRAARTGEYVEALRSLWGEDVSTYHGSTVDFEQVRCYPKPVGGRVPVVVGGNSDGALERAAAYGDGWYGFAVPRAELAGRVATLRARCAELGRDPATLEVSVNVADLEPADVAEVAAQGVDELVVVAGPPDDPAQVGAWIGSLAERWVG